MERTPEEACMEGPGPLPDAERVRLAMTFDDIAEDYDAIRPAYPAALFDDLVALADLTPGSRVLEVGPGTGLATRGLLGRGLDVVGVEPGERLAAVARRRAGPDRLRLEIATFEDWDPSGRRFDLVFSATAFHWVDPDRRWSKTAAILRDGGHLALATNRTVAGSTFEEVYAATRDLHLRYAPGMDEGPSPSAEELRDSLVAGGRDIGTAWGAADPKGGSFPAGARFDPPTVRTYDWEARYDAGQAAALLSTYSPYLALGDEPRRLLLDAVRATVERAFGGSVTRRYLSVLAVARRADAPSG